MRTLVYVDQWETITRVNVNLLIMDRIVNIRSVSIHYMLQHALEGVAVSRGYDTCFGKGLVMGYADC